jgi:hypothetical protein
MKALVILASLIVGSTVLAASKDSPTYTQCTVDFPDETKGGVCKDVGEKHFLFYTCSGELVAFVEPGALPTVIGPTCGSNYKGYEESLKK